MTQLDLLPAVERLIALAGDVRPDDNRPTPCPDLPVSLLLAHLHGMAIEFAAAAGQTPRPEPQPQPAPAQATGDLPQRLRQLAAAWQADAAWERMTTVGGLDLPGAFAGRIALGEVVIHSWDLARATDQVFAPDSFDIEVVERTCRELRGGNNGDLPGLFGAAVTPARNATPLDRMLAIAGRDPKWTSKESR